MKLPEPKFDSLERLRVAAAAMLRPAERITVSQYAEKYRYLNNPGSSVGYWRNEKTPYLVEPMDELSSLDYTAAIFVGPARTGKSDMFLNWLGHTVETDPADMMLIHMTQNTARDWSQGDLKKMLRHTSTVGAQVSPGKHNTHDLRFKSGMRLLIKWPSISELSGKTIPRIWGMDYDRMDQDVDGEGNPFDLMRKRTESFKRFGMTVAESSPGFEVTNAKWVASSPHEAPPTKGILELYNRGDRRRWYWRCLHCNEAFEAGFEHLVYPNSSDFMEAAEATVLVCPHCGGVHEPSDKQALNVNGKWLKEGEIWLPDGSVTGKARRSNIASFWMKGTAAVFQDWSSLVLNYLQAQEAYDKTGDTGPLKKTINTDQGLPFTPPSLKAGRLPEELKDRAEDWGGSKEYPVVPDGVRFLIATIDVQAGSRSAFVVQVQGFHASGDVAIVDTFKIRKSDRIDENDARLEHHLIDPAGYPEDWELLVPQVIERSYPLADNSGRRMQIKLTTCDSGGKEGVTTNAYAFWRWLRDKHGKAHHNRFLLVKGEPSKTAPRMRVGYPDTSKKDRFNASRGDVPVMFFNSTQLKDQAYAMLGRKDSGGGTVRFPIWAENWLYSQLTAEVRTADRWENSSKKKNEAWDLLYYAIGSALHPTIRIEHINWEMPPKWAEEWDQNDLVFGEDTADPFIVTDSDKFDLASIAADLA